MDSIDNMRAFAEVVRTGSFTAAAEALGVTPAIISKRVVQLERQTGFTLLHRTTRRVFLSAEGEYHLGRIKALLAVYDETFTALRQKPERLEGRVRIKVPSTLGFAHLNALLLQFARKHPGIDLEVLLLDGTLNPIVESIDIAITAFPMSFDGVSDETLWPIRRALFASPDYLARHGTIEHPSQLEAHRCIVYQPTGPSWPFLGDTGLVHVTVRPWLSSNDMLMLLNAVRQGEGIGLLSHYVAATALQGGQIEVVIPRFRVPDLWVKAMVPAQRLVLPRVRSLLDFIREQHKQSINDI